MNRKVRDTIETVLEYYRRGELYRLPCAAMLRDLCLDLEKFLPPEQIWEGPIKEDEEAAYWRGVRDEAVNLIDITEQHYLETCRTLNLRKRTAEEKLNEH